MYVLYSPVAIRINEYILDFLYGNLTLHSHMIIFVCNGIPSCYLMHFINFAFTFSITTFLFMLSYTFAPELKMSTILACIVCHYFAFLLPNDWHWDEFQGHPTKYTQFHFQYKQSLISQIATTFIKVAHIIIKIAPTFKKIMTSYYYHWFWRHSDKE